MKTGVQSVSVKLIDPEVTDSFPAIFERPEDFHGTTIGEEKEIEVSGRRYAVLESEGSGLIGPWTRISLRIDPSDCAIDMVIALDTSYSMITDFEDTTRFDLAVNGIIDLVGQKSKHLVVGVMAYGVDWEMSLDMINAKTFTKKKLSDLRKELGNIKHKGKAAAGTALNGASEVFSIKGLNDLKIVVLLSDGADEIGPNPLKEADKLVSRGIYIYPFYFGEEKDQKSLTIFERIAAKSHTTLFSLYNVAEHEKRRLIRASLMAAGKEDGDDDRGPEAAPAEVEPGEEEGDKPEADVQNEGETEKQLPEEGEDEVVVPSGSELLLRDLRELGDSPTFIIQEGGEAFPSDEEGDVQVIKAGIPVEEEEQPETNEPTFKRTPKIIDAIKNFIEWVKSLIW